MALLDRWRRRRDEGPIPGDVQAEVEAVDAILRGETAPQGMEELDELVRDLRAERPSPNQRYAQELDSWAADGFPRDRRPGAQPSAGGFFGRVTLGRLAPAGAVAATLLVAVVAISQIDGGDDQQLADGGAEVTEEPTGGLAPQAEPAPPVADAVGGGSAAEALESQAKPAGRNAVTQPFASVVIRVASGDVGATRSSATAAAQRVGGGQRQTFGGDGPIELKVPAERVDDVVAELRRLGETTVRFSRRPDASDSSELTLAVRIVAE